VLSCQFCQAWGWWLGETSLCLPSVAVGETLPAAGCQGLVYRGAGLSFGYHGSVRGHLCQETPMFCVQFTTDQGQSGFIYDLITFLHVILPMRAQSWGEHLQHVCALAPGKERDRYSSTTGSRRSAIRQ